MQNKAIEVIEVIRHSLAAANAALDLLEPTRASGDTVGLQQAVEVQAAPVVVPVVEAAPQTDLSDRLYAELADSQYNLRTVNELCRKFNVTPAALYDALDDMDESYVKRNRCSDSAPLVGLNTRN